MTTTNGKTKYGIFLFNIDWQIPLCKTLKEKLVTLVLFDRLKKQSQTIEDT